MVGDLNNLYEIIKVKFISYSTIELMKSLFIKITNIVNAKFKYDQIYIEKS